MATKRGSNPGRGWIPTTLGPGGDGERGARWVDGSLTAAQACGDEFEFGFGWLRRLQERERVGGWTRPICRRASEPRCR